MRFKPTQISLLIAFIFMMLPSLSYATEIKTEKTIGAGIGVGSTSALTAKYYMSPNKALQAFFGTGGYIGAGDSYAVGEIDYLVEDIIQEQDFGEIFWGYGAGAKFYNYYGDTGTGIGLVGILEAGVHLKDEPVEVVLDIRPDLSIGNGLTFYYTYGGSVRYYF